MNHTFFILIFSLGILSNSISFGVDPSILACVNKQAGQSCDTLAFFRSENPYTFKGTCEQFPDFPGVLICAPIKPEVTKKKECSAKPHPRTGQGAVPAYCRCNNKCQAYTGSEHRVGLTGECAHDFCTAACEPFGGWAENLPRWNLVPFNSLVSCALPKP